MHSNRSTCLVLHREFCKAAGEGKKREASKQANKQQQANSACEIEDSLRKKTMVCPPLEPSHNGSPKVSWRLAKSVRSVWKPGTAMGDVGYIAQVARVSAPSKVSGASPDDSCVSSCIAALRKGSGKVTQSRPLDSPVTAQESSQISH